MHNKVTYLSTQHSCNPDAAEIHIYNEAGLQHLQQLQIFVSARSDSNTFFYLLHMSNRALCKKCV